MIVDHRADFSGKFVEAANNPICHAPWTDIPLLQIISNTIHLQSYESRDGKGTWKACYKAYQRQIIRDVRTVSLTFDIAHEKNVVIKPVVIRLQDLLNSMWEHMRETRSEKKMYF